MGSDFSPYYALVVVMVLSFLLVTAMLVLNAVLGPKRRSHVKMTPFECGNEPWDNPRKRMSVKYYLVAIFFIVFDIEAVFLYPWSILYRGLLKNPGYGILALWEMLLFVGILSIGLAYVWGKGDLDWNPGAKK